MNAGKVTIGIPVYNGAEYLSGALESALGQTFSNFEIIIADNASTDDTELVCKRFVEIDSRIKYVRHSNNIGANANFSFVKDQADGEYFVWLAHDDRWMPEFLDRAVKILDSDSECPLVFSDFLVRNLETGEEFIRYTCSSNSSIPILRCAIRLIDTCPSAVYGVHRLESLITTEFKNFDFADVHFLVELSIKGRIRMMNSPLYIAGTKGVRIPYSLNGGRIQRMPFIRQQISMFFSSFPVPHAFALSLLVVLVMIKSRFSGLEESGI